MQQWPLSEPIDQLLPFGRAEHGVRGINNYTDWFAGDKEMKGDYGGYDGPFPP